jgi:hypothetical protein
MIGLPSSTKIYLCTQPVDFRKGFDGLAGIVTGRSSATRSPVTDRSRRPNMRQIKKCRDLRDERKIS